MDNNSILQIDGYSFNDELGPEGKSFVSVWFHGCNRNCPGCIAEDWNRRSKAILSISAEYLLEMIADEAEARGVNIDGFVISGGEPFRQSEGIVKFIHLASSILEISPDVMIYTGYTLGELLRCGVKKTSFVELLSMVDVLVDGRYIKELDVGEPYKGSSNQSMYFLTNKYSSVDFPNRPRKTSIKSDRSEISLVGIPTKEASKMWKDIRKFLI